MESNSKFKAEAVGVFIVLCTFLIMVFSGATKSDNEKSGNKPKRDTIITILPHGSNLESFTDSLKTRLNTTKN